MQGLGRVGIVAQACGSILFLMAKLLSNLFCQPLFMVLHHPFLSSFDLVEMQYNQDNFGYCTYRVYSFGLLLTNFFLPFFGLFLITFEQFLTNLRPF